MRKVQAVLIAEMPDGISVVSVMSELSGQQRHSYQLQRDGATLGEAPTLHLVSELLDALR
jgi:hypothetical protein